MRHKEDYFKTTFEDPPHDFCEWWSPSRRDHESGADIGGHPDAERVWARKDPGRWVHRTYGTNARIAWNAQRYRNEFLAWVDLGKPEREEFISLAAPVERQKQFWKELKTTISSIGKPMPKPETFDYDAQTEAQPY
jgi:hypothetical protein